MGVTALIYCCQIIWAMVIRKQYNDNTSTFVLESELNVKNKILNFIIYYIKYKNVRRQR